MLRHLTSIYFERLKDAMEKGLDIIAIWLNLKKKKVSLHIHFQMQLQLQFYWIKTWSRWQVINWKKVS